MEQNREEILADFQACTGIEDVAEAIYHLDETDWDLLRAVNRVVPADSQAFNVDESQDVVIVDQEMPLPEPPVDAAIDITDDQPVSIGVGVNLDDNVQPSTSTVKDSNSSRNIRFNVKYCERIIPIDIPDTGTIADLKMNLSDRLKIAPCRQLLSGWARLTQYENTPFTQLMLPNENTIYLHVKSNNGGFSAEDELEVTERFKGTYTLKITDENANKHYSLKYNGSKTILEVKTDVFTLTDIHVRNQLWSGWPPNIDDQTVLALSGISILALVARNSQSINENKVFVHWFTDGSKQLVQGYQRDLLCTKLINYPEHSLTLKRNSTMNHNNERRPNNIIELPDSDDDEFEDATESFTVDDEMFVDNLGSKRIEPLIPEHVEDEIVGTISFSEQFSARYGQVHAPFYQGTLEDAIKEACRKSAKDRKILAVYLHHDASVLSNVFCTQLLGCESIIQTLEANFIVWGWDLTFESNRASLQNSVSRCLGSTAAASLRNIPVDRLPAIIIIMKLRSSTDVFSVVHGNVGVNDLLTNLIEAVEVFMEHQRVEIREEDERAARELVKWEQDQAYRASLEADRAKEEAKRMHEQAINAERQRVETEKNEEAAKKEAFRQQVEASLPPEPNQDQGDNITKIRFRLPKGDYLERRFHGSSPLKVVLDYLIVEGYPTNEFKVISSWPRRDLTSLDTTTTLQELKLCPQETVILEER